MSLISLILTLNTGLIFDYISNLYFTISADSDHQACARKGIVKAK